MRFLNPDKTAVMDHNAAVASAVAWLGNRYLLARPTRRLIDTERCSADLAAAPSVPHRSLSANNQLRDARDQKSSNVLRLVKFPAK
jgi:hypothetical protein